jgi:medium-chain acyl-[acyl-carrier-protein] hydrolase
MMNSMSLAPDGQTPTPAIPLLCFPHAGGSAAVFRPWREAFGRVADVVPVEIAGHGARRGEPLPLTLEDALTTAWPALSGPAEGDYALFGHSLGALYAFEAARRLARPPRLLAVSGRNAPARPAELPECHRLPDDQFARHLASFGGIPAEIRDDPDLMRFFLPVLRADMRIAERYVRGEGEPLDCPVMVFRGERDPLASAAGVAAWARETTRRCEVVRLPGGHFSLWEDGGLDRLAAALSE